VQRHARTHPSDRSEGAAQAAAPVAEPQAKGLPRVSAFESCEKGAERRPSSFRGALSEALVADKLVDGLASAFRAVRTRVVFGLRTADHHHLPRHSVLGNAE